MIISDGQLFVSQPSPPQPAEKHPLSSGLWMKKQVVGLQAKRAPPDKEAEQAVNWGLCSAPEVKRDQSSGRRLPFQFGLTLSTAEEKEQEGKLQPHYAFARLSFFCPDKE